MLTFLRSCLSKKRHFRAIEEHFLQEASRIDFLSPAKQEKQNAVTNVSRWRRESEVTISLTAELFITMTYLGFTS